MERRLSVAFTARPKRMACSTAARLSTGSTPGSAMSTADAWVLGAAPKAVGAPEKILLNVASCAWVSIPTTTSQLISARSFRHRMQQPALPAAVDQQRLEVRLGAAARAAVLRRDLHVLAQLAQRQAALPVHEMQPALGGLLLELGHAAAVAGGRELRAPRERPRLELPRLDAVLERRLVARIARIAAHGGAVAFHGGQVLGELEALALL